MSDLTSLSLADLRSGLDSGRFSSIEVTEAFLGRLEEHQVLNSFVTVDADLALAQARQADQKIAERQRGNLLGIPIGIKDLIATADLPTTCASKMLENYRSPFDAHVIELLRKQGAVILGKTNMDEFAMGSSNENSFFGAVKNPWNSERVAGGSSGGSAAAVAARLAPVTLGSDTGGSIRQPASYCGVVGLKPTYGRVSRYGLIAFASSLDQIGVFGSSAIDVALASEAIFGHDRRDSTSVANVGEQFSSKIGCSVEGVRIGIPEEYFVAGIDPEVEASVRKAIDLFKEQGAEVVPVSLPHTKYAVACYYILASAEASSNLSRFDGVRYGHRAENIKSLGELYRKTRSEGFGPEVKRRILIGTYVLSAGYYDAFYLKAQRVRSLITNDFNTAFGSACDLIATPTAPTTAFKIGEKVDDPVKMYLNDIFTIPTNLAGLPGLSLPCGFSSQNLPIGLQLIGKPWAEHQLLSVANAYQQLTDWHTKTASLG